jgi:hypothetical protein
LILLQPKTKTNRFKIKTLIKVKSDIFKLIILIKLKNATNQKDWENSFKIFKHFEIKSCSNNSKQLIT